MPRLKVLKNAEPVATSDRWYDLTDGGYIDPADLLEPASAAIVEDAIDIIQAFFETLEENDLIEYS